jgi:uncharacterized protein YbaR (Trm112 family)
MALEHALLTILACPVDKGSLLYFEDEMILYNPRLRRRYPIRDGVPVMLAHLAEPVGAAEHALLVDRAQAGDAVPTQS